MFKIQVEQRGQAVVEMALVLPLLFLLLFGVTEMGRVGYAYISVNNAARAGARTASVGGDDIAVTNAILASAPALDSTKLSIQIVPSFSSRQSGQTATVTVTYPVKLILTLFQGILPNPFIVEASLSMRLE